MAAAVADFRPKEIDDGKIKKDEGVPEIVVEPTPDIVAELGGSFSAEHGIGKLKRAELAHYKSPGELAAMRAIKAALDPHNIMNPGKVL